MTNTFNTASVPALTAMAILENNKVVSPLVNKGYVADVGKSFNGYERGQTIPVALSPKFAPEIWDGSNATPQSIAEDVRNIVINDLIQVPFELTAVETSLILNALKPDGGFQSDFFSRVIVPLMESMADYEDKYILKKGYQGTPFYYGTAGSTPDGVDDITGVRKVLNDAKCPNKNRSLILDTTADAKMLQLDTFVEADKAGTTSAQQEAILGRKFGFGCFMSQNVATHIKGTLAAGTAGTISVKGAVAAGAKTMTLDSTTLTGTLVVGDILKITDATTSVVSYAVVTAGSTAETNEIAVTCKAALKANGEAVGIANDSTVEVIGTHSANLAFNQDGIIHVSVPMAVGKEGYIIQNPYTGEGISFTEDGYNSATKKHKFCAQFFVATLVREQCVARLLG